jgi:hypothetical protein
MMTSSAAAWKMALSPPLLQTALALPGSAPQMTRVSAPAKIQQAICPPRRQDKAGHHRCGSSLQGARTSTGATHHARYHQEFVAEHRQICNHQLHHHFDKEEVNIYDTNNTIIAVTRGAILRGWWDAATKLWHIPLIAVVRNNNTNTIIVN